MATHHHNEEMAVQQQRWQTESVEPVLRDFPERQVDFTTPSYLFGRRITSLQNTPGGLRITKLVLLRSHARCGSLSEGRVTRGPDFSTAHPS